MFNGKGLSIRKTIFENTCVSKSHSCVMNYQMKTKDTYMKGRYVNIIDVIL